jgi:hypothetical protein
LRDDWVVSAPSEINDWFEREVQSRSPEDAGPYQLRRIVRLVKFLGKTWSHATGRRYPSGLLLTALTVEQYKPSLDRLDRSLYNTLRAIGSRHSALPVYANGVLVSNDKDADRIERFTAKAKELADLLQTMIDEPYEHDDESARAIWKKVFRHSFFNPLETKAAEKSEASTGLWGGLSAAVIAERADAAVRETNEPTAPWSG